MAKYNKMDFNSLSNIQQAVENIARKDWATQTSSLHQAVENIARKDWATQTSSLHQAIKNITRNDWSNSNQKLVSSIKHFDSINFAKSFNLLNNFSIREISEVFEEYDDKNKQKYTNGSSEIPFNNTVNEKQRTSYEDLIDIIDSRLESASREKTGFKKFVHELLLSYGQDVVKHFINLIILPFLYLMWNYVVDNHTIIIETIQNSLYNGIYVIGYAHAKKVIKKEGLSRYENLNLIGLIRVPSYIRIIPNKRATPIHSEKVPLDTVVTIVERRKNWFKVEAILNEVSIEGWIEESKVIRFKRKK
ncbi:MAG: hypothetical protein ABS917_03520 [Solibacillus sp.]|uniref:hypothetical protein n=1 Tax=Solibacillus sp. TaxID=1909654 RepID=UPI003315049D